MSNRERLYKEERVREWSEGLRGTRLFPPISAVTSVHKCPVIVLLVLLIPRGAKKMRGGGQWG